MSPASRDLAQLIGPALTAISATELLNPQIFGGHTAAGVYQNGCILFVSGISIIQRHNVWTQDWTVLITMTGWGAAGLGLLRMGFPTQVLETAAREHNNTVAGTTWFLLGIGIWLTWKGMVE